MNCKENPELTISEKIMNFLLTKWIKLLFFVVKSLIRFFGGIPERSKGADCKSAGYAFEGSNPSPSRFCCLVEQRSGSSQVFFYGAYTLIYAGFSEKSRCCRFFMFLWVGNKVKL